MSRGAVLAWRVALPLLLGVLGLALWQVLVGGLGLFERLVPAPAAIAEEWSANAGPIREAAVVTGVNALWGLVVGGVVGVVAAAVAAASRAVDGMIAPIVAGLAVVPIVALAPVLNTMYGADSEVGRRAVAGLAAFVPVFLNTLRGLRQTTPIHRDLMRSHAASPWRTFRVLTLPAAAPFVVTGLRVASSLAVISALVAEYFGGPRGGLGSFISTSAATSAYARAWAYVLAAMVLGLLAYLATVALERAVQRRLPTGTG